MHDAIGRDSCRTQGESLKGTGSRRRDVGFQVIRFLVIDESPSGEPSLGFRAPVTHVAIRVWTKGHCLPLAFGDLSKASELADGVRANSLIRGGPLASPESVL